MVLTVKTGQEEVYGMVSSLLLIEQLSRRIANVGMAEHTYRMFGDGWRSYI